MSTKVGDRIRIIANTSKDDPHEFKIGTIATVTDVKEDSRNRIIAEDESEGWRIHHEDYVIVNEVNVNLPVFPSKEFSDFNNGVSVSNETINEWIGRCYEYLLEHPEMDSTFIGSGNTKVVLFKYIEDGCVWYEANVIQGYYEANFRI